MSPTHRLVSLVLVALAATVAPLLAAPWVAQAQLTLPRPTTTAAVRPL